MVVGPDQGFGLLGDCSLHLGGLALLEIRDDERAYWNWKQRVCENQFALGMSGFVGVYQMQRFLLQPQAVVGCRFRKLIFQGCNR